MGLHLAVTTNSGGPGALSSTGVFVIQGVGGGAAEGGVGTARNRERGQNSVIGRTVAIALRVYKFAGFLKQQEVFTGAICKPTFRKINNLAPQPLICHVWRCFRRLCQRRCGR